MTRHCLTEASSSILPSSMTAPVPSPMAAITRRVFASVIIVVDLSCTLPRSIFCSVDQTALASAAIGGSPVKPAS